eukprot:TRINITY_DN51073_c0_g1_i1.p1 TRINITY_DN51073_c0_g1~~TRINITY_DN51073_c0_g1_i1.p1  ORF type:complete len:333 (-),score=120.10 TRINITY_DN51073_c0_g1_i1:250-1248(-)
MCIRDRVKGPPCPDPSLHVSFEVSWEYLEESGVWHKFPQQVTQQLEIYVEDNKDRAKIEHNGAFFFVYIHRRQCVACESGDVMTIRRRKPAVKTETIHPGAIGAGDKAIKGDDLAVGRESNRAPLEYEQLMCKSMYRIPHDYHLESVPISRAAAPEDEDPMGLGRVLTKTELQHFWGGAPPERIAEKESTREEMLERVQAMNASLLIEQAELTELAGKMHLEDEALKDLAHEDEDTTHMYHQFLVEAAQKEHALHGTSPEGRSNYDVEELAYRLGPRTSAGVEEGSRNVVHSAGDLTRVSKVSQEEFSSADGSTNTSPKTSRRSSTASRRGR